jgi:hypothetical protein
MPRTAYLVELFPNELAALGFVAGLLAAQGAEQGDILAEVLQRVQVVEVEDDGPDDNGQLSLVPDLEEKDVEDEEETETVEEEIGSNVDPESLGVQVNLPAPPPPPPPITRPDEFGAGPGP